MTQKNWKKIYHPFYQELRDSNDPYIIEWIILKENIIAENPKVYGMLGHKLQGIRKYKTGKLRILFVLLNEHPISKEFLRNGEILFLYAGLRKKDTYIEAERYLEKRRII